MKKLIHLLLVLTLFQFTCSTEKTNNQQAAIDTRVNALIKQMTLDEKIGQLIQKNGAAGMDSLVRAGALSSVLNEIDVLAQNQLQRVAMEESRLGIPLIFARDVIHGFNTVLPIPLGQAATWNPDLVKEGAAMSATEARSSGIRWTFSPMIDVTRDPRWGRIAEGYGEDPVLTSAMGVATIKGYQGEELSGKNSMLACAKHFAAYGAAEAGRDYHTVAVPENELRDVYLPPFKAAVEAEAGTFMAAFNEINGIPATGNKFLLSKVLRDEWNFKGFVVSDWESVRQLVVHGYAHDNKDAAYKSFTAGCDMEMASTCYETYLKEMVNSGVVGEELINEAVRDILTIKFKMGLFENPYTNPDDYPAVLNDEHKQLSRNIARESLVLLKNESAVLPLKKDNIRKVAVIGPLADAPHDQLGTWIFDGNKANSTTPLQAIQDYCGKDKVIYAPGMDISRTMNRTGFAKAIDAAKQSDVVLLFIGEESILSGESHCRADISLPGLQEELITEIAKTGKPIVAVVMAGRPLTFEESAKELDAILYAWHPGTMAGPAVADVLFGQESPSGKLPVTFPRTVGQIPIYYAQKNSGKPASDETWERMYEIPPEAFQLSVGNTNHYIDYGFKPWFPFGYGLSYTSFEYSNQKVEKAVYNLGDTIKFSVTVVNTGKTDAKEVVQLYVRDLVGSRTRPVKQLEDFKKVFIAAGDSAEVDFSVPTNSLGFHDQEMNYVTESGDFLAGIGSNSDLELNIQFTIK
ncbi:MAG: beta-glucosidase BglX [Bacteroidales bacterium]|nr:beta-glucosidase BglX [Bacteroidales bacterium]MBN2820992.1 beta-glucosidase BglX [Bacteroidales bacterium]